MTYSISQYCPYSEIINVLHVRYGKNLVYEGRNRNVFELKHCVVKLPKNQDGFTDNDWEGSVSNSLEQKIAAISIQYPKTRLIYIENVPVLFMEKIIPIDWEHHKMDNFPRWIDQVDCGQVGYTKMGRLVAYDYGPR